jgi:hypothetical protein
LVWACAVAKSAACARKLVKRIAKDKVWQYDTRRNKIRRRRGRRRIAKVDGWGSERMRRRSRIPYLKRFS